MDESKLYRELLVVIVLFRRTPDQSEAYTSLHAALNIFRESPDIFIYDNGPDPCPPGAPVTYVHDPENRGVSKAYNQAAAHAARKNKKWLLLLDQDTHVPAQLFAKWRQAVLNHPESVAFVPTMKDRLGIVSPFHFSRGRGKRIRVLEEKFPLRRFRFINSGLFIQCAAFVQAGGYDEQVPLDFSDISFGDRLLEIADHFVVLNILLEHDFSATAGSPLNEALSRFNYFCKGAVALAKKTGRSRTFLVRAFFRAAHLSFNYRNGAFIKIFLQYAFHD